MKVSMRLWFVLLVFVTLKAMPCHGGEEEYVEEETFAAFREPTLGESIRVERTLTSTTNMMGFAMVMEMQQSYISKLSSCDLGKDSWTEMRQYEAMKVDQRVNNQGNPQEYNDQDQPFEVECVEGTFQVVKGSETGLYLKAAGMIDNLNFDPTTLDHLLPKTKVTKGSVLTLDDTVTQRVLRQSVIYSLGAMGGVATLKANEGFGATFKYDLLADSIEAKLLEIDDQTAKIAISFEGGGTVSIQHKAKQVGTEQEVSVNQLLGTVTLTLDVANGRLLKSEISSTCEMSWKNAGNFKMSYDMKSETTYSLLRNSETTEEGK